MRFHVLRRGRLCFTLTVLIAAAGLFTDCGRRRPMAEHKGRIIPLTDTILDTGGTDTVRFGRLHSGEIAVLRLWLANRTERPLAVISYGRSCGCTTLDYDSEPITPGGMRQVSLTFDSRGERGWQLKTLDLHFTDGRRPLRLFVEAEIE